MSAVVGLVRVSTDVEVVVAGGVPPTGEQPEQVVDVARQADACLEWYAAVGA